MTGTSIQSGSSVIQVLKRQREEKEKQIPHVATPEHFKNQGIFNSNQIQKKYRKTQQNGDNNLKSAFFSKTKTNLKLKIQKRK